jgi:Tfp pilus assembly protein PilF
VCAALFKPDHPEVAVALMGLAVFYISQEKTSQAEPLLRRALAIWENTLGSEHPQLAGGLEQMGILYHQQGKQRQAETLLQRALTIRENSLGRDHPDVATSLKNLEPCISARGNTKG